MVWKSLFLTHKTFLREGMVYISTHHISLSYHTASSSLFDLQLRFSDLLGQRSLFLLFLTNLIPRKFIHSFIPYALAQFIHICSCYCGLFLQSPIPFPVAPFCRECHKRQSYLFEGVWQLCLPRRRNLTVVQMLFEKEGYHNA